MKKSNVVWLMLLMIGMAGCSNPIQTTIDHNTPFNAPAQLSKEDKLILESLDKQEGWQIYQSSGTQHSLYHTTDQGKTWTRAQLPFTRESGVTKEQLFTNFHAKVSSHSSWLLVTSDPSAGQMEKSLYHSDNEGKWSFVTEVGMAVDGYPTGIYFLDNQNGWIAAKQHGKSLVPLFRTTDGGKSWNIQTIAIPSGFKYGNVYPPTFLDSTNGSITIDFVSDDNHSTLTYLTVNGGETWEELKQKT